MARRARRSRARPVDGVFFTGSYATGARIAAAAEPAHDQGPARARRQGSRLRLRRRRRQGGRGRHRRRRVLQHRTVLLLGRADLRARVDPRRVRRRVRRGGQGLQDGRSDGRVDLHRRDHAAPAARRAEEAGRRREEERREAPHRRQRRARQGQLVRADGLRRRRSLDGA